MERMATIRDALLAQIEKQMECLECTNTEELGEVIDMVMDLTKAMYYCKQIQIMEQTNTAV